MGLPSDVVARIPFPGPALAERAIGDVTPVRIGKAHKATVIVDYMLRDTEAFQYLVIVHYDRVTGMHDGKWDFGLQMEVHCWDSVDARVAEPSQLSYDVLKKLAREIIHAVPGVCQCNPQYCTQASLNDAAFSETADFLKRGDPRKGHDSLPCK